MLKSLYERAYLFFPFLGYQIVNAVHDFLGFFDRGVEGPFFGDFKNEVLINLSVICKFWRNFEK